MEILLCGMIKLAAEKPLWCPLCVVSIRWTWSLLIYILGNIAFYCLENIDSFTSNRIIINVVKGVTLDGLFLLIILVLAQASFLFGEGMSQSLQNLNGEYKVLIEFINFILIFVLIGESRLLLSFFANKFSSLFHLYTLFLFAVFGFSALIKEIPLMLLKDFTIFKVRKRKGILGRIIRIIKFFDTEEDEIYIYLLVSVTNIVVFHALFFLLMILLFITSFMIVSIIVLVTEITLWVLLIQRVRKLSSVESLEMMTQILITFLLFYMIFTFIFMTPFLMIL